MYAYNWYKFHSFFVLYVTKLSIVIFTEIDFRNISWFDFIWVHYMFMLYNKSSSLYYISLICASLLQKMCRMFHFKARKLTHPEIFNIVSGFLRSFAMWLTVSCFLSTTIRKIVRRFMCKIKKNKNKKYYRANDYLN